MRPYYDARVSDIGLSSSSNASAGISSI